MKLPDHISMLKAFRFLNGKEWDVFTWLYATTEFFKVKKQISRILQELGMPGC
jgi:hypothetical protein